MCRILKIDYVDRKEKGIKKAENIRGVQEALGYSSMNTKNMNE
ncbi:hypothetical protein AB1I92_01290 [Bacillus mobilis]|uniref:Resolvase/invertase-type recombinase catalytic domain-containing protein n=1 Tax=Bacillus mobilis TaxID=2026190 RepID=A0ABV4RXE5_9BACI|nr:MULTISPECIES: hypothetical protein [Bacillus cereus group]MCU5593083.1 hypothetical protein [Bacillus mobilis]SCB92047.1 Uncharacterized protein BC0861_00981 [Bacillus mobilis]